MLRNRLLILLGGCLLATSAAWADDVGYIDCQNHPEDTKVLGKAGKTSEVVTSMPCGERFTILLTGFFFTRIQTKDGSEGFVYSNLISHDRSATSVQQPARAPAAAPTSNVPTTTATLVQAKPVASSQPPPAAVQPALAPAPARTPSVPATTATVVQPEPSPPPQPEPAPAQSAAHAPRSKAAKTGLERSIPSTRKQPLVELFGGYAFLRLDNGAGAKTNLK